MTKTRLCGLLLGALLAPGCVEPPVVAQVAWTPTGVRVEASAPIRWAELLDPAGAVALRWQPAAPTSPVELAAWPTEDGVWSVRVQAQDQPLTLPLPWEADRPPLYLQVEAPVGQGARELGAGEVVEVVQVGGRPVPVAVEVVAARAGPVELSVGGERQVLERARPGQRLRWTGVVQAPVGVVAQAAGREAHATLRPRPISEAQAQEALTLEAVHFPAEASGRADPTRSADRVRLPSPLWQALLRRTRLGFRAEDPSLPWAWQGVRLRNHSAEDLTVVVRAGVLGPEGQPAPGFRPRLREAEDGTGQVSALLRVPAGGEALAALPVFVDPQGVEARVYTRRVEVGALGLERPLQVWEGPLAVDAGEDAGTLGAALGLGAAALGWGLLLARGPRWLREASTSALMTLSMVGALLFFVGAAGRLLAMGVAAALGPFGVLLTALVDEAVRTALLAVLLTLRPQVGSAALALGVAWGLSALALGGLTPADALFFGAQVAWTEAALWLCGVSRDGAWRETPSWARWARLTAAFAGSGSAALLTGLALSAALFRLYYAPWYVALLLAGPGVLYAGLACALAVPFAASLRRVQP